MTLVTAQSRPEIMTEPNKTVFATFQCVDLFGNVTEEPKSLTVPVEQKWQEWLHEFEDLAEQIGNDSELTEVVIQFRLDGTDKPATWLERLQDALHAPPVFASRLVPIWCHASI
jgi:hypothetical protein